MPYLITATQQLSTKMKLKDLHKNRVGLINLIDIEVCNDPNSHIANNNHSHYSFQYRGLIPTWAEEYTIRDLVEFISSTRDESKRIVEYAFQKNEDTPMIDELWEEFKIWLECRKLNSYRLLKG